MFGIPALTSARKAVGFLLLPILFALVGLSALMVTQVYGQSAPGSMDAPTLDPSSSAIAVTWVAPSDNGGSDVTGYKRQYRSNAGSGWSGWEEKTYSDASTLSDSFNASDSSPGTKGTLYEVQMRATNAQGDGPWSTVATDKFGSKINFPGKYVIRDITENATGNVGGRISPNRGGSGDAPLYSLTGSGSNLFNIGSSNGQISIKGSTEIDYESLSSKNLGDVYSNDRGWALTVAAEKAFCVGAEDCETFGASTRVIIVVLDQDGEPEAPTNLTATPGDERVVLNWNDPSDSSITKYQMRQDQGSWSDIADSVAATTTHMVSGLTSGTEYTFSVRAKNGVGAGGAASVTITPGEDLDGDDDGLIQVSNLAQLNALRWDLDGDGSSTVAGYATAFSTARTGMGCPESGCIGYELTTDLDFDANGDGVVDSSDEYWDDGAGWEPIVRYVDPGEGESRVTHPFNAAFDGGGHTVANLFINRTTDNIGLFGVTGSGSVVRNVGLPSANVTGNQGVGALVGRVDSGKIAASFSTGSVTGTSNDVGGLVGRNNSGSIAVSYSTAAVSGDTNVGGLVGYTEEGAIKASYATGPASGEVNVGGLVGQGGSGSMQACYAIGPVTGSFSDGLVGLGGATISYSYWDTETTDTTGVGGRTAVSHGLRKQHLRYLERAHR